MNTPIYSDNFLHDKITGKHVTATSARQKEGQIQLYHSHGCNSVSSDLYCMKLTEDIEQNFERPCKCNLDIRLVLSRLQG